MSAADDSQRVARELYAERLAQLENALHWSVSDERHVMLRELVILTIALAHNAGKVAGSKAATRIYDPAAPQEPRP